jgi:chromosome segregation ATPase
LREQIEALEEELSHIKLNFTNSDLIRKRLTSAEQSLLEKQSVLNELESDNQALNQQIELANSKIQRLREDLLNEKTRLADLLSRLRSICTTCRLKSSDADQRLSDEELMKDDNLMINTIDSLLLSVFTAARTEADSLKAERQVQLEEINVLRRNIEDLKETHSQFDTANGDVTQDTLRNKLGVLQERLNASLARENEITAEVQAAKRTVEDLQRQLQQSMKTNAELTRLRISQRELEQEMHSVKQSLSDTTEKLHLSNKERHDLNNKLIRQQQTHQAQQTEIERLTNLNNSLAHDFDRSRFDNNELKRKIDQLNDANLTSTNRHLEYNNIEESMRQARDALKSERDRLAISEQSLTRITRELNETRRDYAALLRQKDTTSEELAQLSETNAAQKSVITSLNLTIQQLNNALSDKENELASFRKEIGVKRHFKCFTLILDSSRVQFRREQAFSPSNRNAYATKSGST